MKKSKGNFEKEYDRLMLRSAFVSLIANGIRYRRQYIPDLNLTNLAKMVGKDKATLSRDLSGSPNWRTDTLSDLAGALGLEVRVSAIDRATGVVIGCTEEEVRTFRVEMKSAKARPVGVSGFHVVEAESA